MTTPSITVLQSPRRDMDPTIPGLRLVWDSTSLRALLKCPRYFFLNNICGYNTIDMAIELDFGIRAHSVREYWIRQTTVMPPEDALRSTVRYVLENPGPDWDDPIRNRTALLRFAVWMADAAISDQLQTIVNGDMVYVEKHFMFNLFNYKGRNFYWAGHIDRLAWDGTLWPEDLKTTARLDQTFWTRFRPDIQLPGYVLGSSTLGFGQPTGIKILAAGFSRNAIAIERSQIVVTIDDINNWYETVNHYIIQAYHHAEKNSWPMNPESCYDCPFRRVCTLPPSEQQTCLDATFARVEWNPTVPRTATKE